MPPVWPAAAAADSYDMALVTRLTEPLPDDDGGVVLRRPGHRSDPRAPRTGATSTTPRSTSCSPRPPRRSIRSRAATVYAQIDDQLWDQMVAVPLFAEPGLEANGVQLANVEYNPSVDGILWNVALWTTLKPGPAGHQTSPT